MELIYLESLSSNRNIKIVYDDLINLNISALVGLSIHVWYLCEKLH